jgi:Homeodomain-like domain
LAQKGKRKAKDIMAAHILLNSDENFERKSESYIAQTFQTSTKTVERVREGFCLHGMGFFDPRPRKPRSDKKIDARVEAHLIKLLCETEEEVATNTPDKAMQTKANGEKDAPKPVLKKWKLQMLADKLIELEVVEHISTTMVGRLLKKMNLSPFSNNNG